MSMSTRYLPMVGFHGTDANRGLLRYEYKAPKDLTNEDVQKAKAGIWGKIQTQLPVGKELSSKFDKTGVLTEKDRQTLVDLIKTPQVYMKLENQEIHTLIEDISILQRSDEDVKEYLANKCNEPHQRHRHDKFDTSQAVSASLPIINIISGLSKIILGIIDDGSLFGIIEKDRGFKFKATMIAVGVAEICLLGLLVHGVASLYFAATTPPEAPQLA